MRAAEKFTRRHLWCIRRFHAPPVLPPISPSPSNSALPIHRRKFNANPHHSPSCSPLFFQYAAHRSFSWFARSNSEEWAETEEDSGGSSEGRLGLNPVEGLETVPEPSSILSAARSEISDGVLDENENTWYYYPIQSVMSTLDCFHDFTGFPWYNTFYFYL
ncbi:hypothetical protein KSP40_PGU012191 [Platanthera guangdongensis]|uniref:Uncharacterized protein n=1 Tax=Platanthera guangdongensis TaxID=2320717 RepID=A0ABR2M3B7_9ASPA